MTSDTDPITLKDAAQHFGFSVWTLRTEADRGRLTIYRIGRKDYTTPNDIKEMVSQCRVEKKAHGSISTPRNQSSIALPRMRVPVPPMAMAAPSPPKGVGPSLRP